MKDSGIPWMPLIPSDWHMVPNYAVFDEVKRVVGDRADEYTLLSLTKQGVIVRDLEAGGKFPANFDTYKVVEPGQMIFCLFDIDETPRTVGLSHHHGMITGAYDVFNIKKDVCDSRYLLYYYLIVDDGKHLRPYYGSLRKTVTPTVFRHLKVPLPSLAEQQRIADYLDGRCAAIDEVRKTIAAEIEALWRLRKATIHRAVTKGLDEGVPMRDSEAEWIGTIPNHWSMRRLKYCVLLSTSKACSLQNYIGLENIESYSAKRIGVQLSPENTALGFFEGDVLFGKLRPYLSKSYCAKTSGCCSSEFLVLRPVLFFSRFLLYLTLDSSFVDEINSSTYGTKMPRANWSFIGNMLTPLPVFSEQQCIADYLDERCAAIDSVIDTRTKQLERLEDYRRALVFAYVTGKKEVPSHE